MVTRGALVLAGIAVACGLTGCPRNEAGSAARQSPDAWQRSLVAKAAARLAGAGIDVDAYLLFYDQSLPLTFDGARLIALIERFDEEIGARERADEPLWARAQTALGQWDEATRAFVEGNGAQVTVTQSMVDSADLYFARLSGIAGPDLAAAIASERKVRPPLQTLVGLDLDAAADVLFPPQRLFRDDFE